MTKENALEFVQNHYFSENTQEDYIFDLNKILSSGKVKQLEINVNFVSREQDDSAAENYWEVIAKIDITGRAEELSIDEDDDITNLLHFPLHDNSSYKRLIDYHLKDTAFTADHYTGLLIEANFL